MEFTRACASKALIQAIEKSSGAMTNSMGWFTVSSLGPEI